jgi:hypothetical protein
MSNTCVSICVVLLAMIGVPAVEAEEPGAAPGLFLEPESMVASVYDAVSDRNGDAPDWDAVRSYFDPDSLVVLRATREETKKFDVDGFIQDFVAFYDRIEGTASGFAETVVSLDCLEYGNIAHCDVVYEAAILGSDRAPQRGLDSWHLMKSGGRWWVVSVVNEVETVAGAIPGQVLAD